MSGTPLGAYKAEMSRTVPSGDMEAVADIDLNSVEKSGQEI